MTKLEILYDWPIVEIKRLADSAVAEAFAATLVEPALSSYTTVTEQMRGIAGDLSAAKANGDHFTHWGDLRHLLESFKANFSSFPDPSFLKFQLFTLLAEMLAQTAAPLDATVIDENQFEIRELQNMLPLSWFSRENSLHFEDSLAIFSCANLPSLEHEIGGATISPHFLFHLLAALLPLADVPPRPAALVKKNHQPIPIEAIDGFARLVVLASGKAVHFPHRYSNPPMVVNPDFFRAGYSYHQWNEVFNVISEYNSRDEILLKFLTLYHVVENLMFKFPIVELERQNGGRMFSIRDFRRLYQQVDETETAAIKRLFTAVLKEEVRTGVTFETHVVTRWQALVPTVISANNLEQAIGLLGIKKDRRPLRFTEFRVGGECAGYFSSFVYQTRCAIVHNKETEFHLTYASLDAAFITLLEKFLIPSLEEICFALIGSPNQQVWYSGKQLLLYQ